MKALVYRDGEIMQLYPDEWPWPPDAIFNCEKGHPAPANHGHCKVCGSNLFFVTRAGVDVPRAPAKEEEISE